MKCYTTKDQIMLRNGAPFEHTHIYRNSVHYLLALYLVCNLFKWDKMTPIYMTEHIFASRVPSIDFSMHIEAKRKKERRKESIIV